jgi:hypothetical protein
MGLRGLDLSDSGKLQLAGSSGHGGKTRNSGNFMKENVEGRHRYTKIPAVFLQELSKFRNQLSLLVSNVKF